MAGCVLGKAHPVLLSPGLFSTDPTAHHPHFSLLTSDQRPAVPASTQPGVLECSAVGSGPDAATQVSASVRNVPGMRSYTLRQAVCKKLLDFVHQSGLRPTFECPLALPGCMRVVVML